MVAVVSALFQPWGSKLDLDHVRPRHQSSSAPSGFFAFGTLELSFVLTHHSISPLYLCCLARQIYARATSRFPYLYQVDSHV